MPARLFGLALFFCACSAGNYQVASLSDDAGTPDSDASEPAFPVSGIGSNQLLITGIEPAAGPFSGGTKAVVRGGGFTKNASVRIGGTLVPPAATSLDDKGHIAVTVPPGTVGLADVTVTDGTRKVTLAHGFHYNALAFDPASGSTAGGTQVQITASGASFDPNLAAPEVRLDGLACTDVTVLTPLRLRCKTPAHAVAVVDAVVSFPAAAERTLTAQSAFDFVETGDDNRGGLSGATIHGTLNVSVVDSGAGFVLPGAFVLVGDDPHGKYQGLTDARGKITFSGDDLLGPVTVHVSKECFERSSIVTFDAENATVFMSPILDFSCADHAPPDAGGHGQLGAIISGQLIFPGSDEFGVNPWDIVPKPRAGEVRVSYVFTTQTSLDQGNPPADITGTLARVEETSAALGERGYLYSIFARPGGLAVYALAGLERASDGKFTPYAMGVARNVVTSPGDESRDVDLDMSITLDRELAINLSGMPAAISGMPNQYRVRSYVDLGGEGVITRTVQGTSLDVVTRYTSASVFRFIGQPAFVGALADASYGLVAGFYTDGSDLPYTEQSRVGITQASDAVVVGDFLGIPQPVAPAVGQTIPKDRTLRFSLDGPTPDVIQIELIGGDGNPAWQLVLPGTARQATLPDLSVLTGQSDIAAGQVTWTVTAGKLQAGSGFVFNQFQYSDLSARALTRSAANAFVMRR